MTRINPWNDYYGAYHDWEQEAMAEMEREAHERGECWRGCGYCLEMKRRDREEAKT